MSSVEIKTKREIDLLREACRMAADTLLPVGDVIKAGMSTDHINRFVHQDTIRRGSRTATS